MWELRVLSGNVKLFVPINRDFSGSVIRNLLLKYAFFQHNTKGSALVYFRSFDK